jgi:hypothetical protein
VSVASAVKWLQRWRDHNSATSKPRGGSLSPREANGNFIELIRGEFGLVDLGRLLSVGLPGVRRLGHNFLRYRRGWHDDAMELAHSIVVRKLVDVSPLSVERTDVKSLQAVGRRQAS